MRIKKYTLAEFRKNTREAFDNVEQGGLTVISRNGKRYGLKFAEVQSGKEQFKQPKTVVEIAAEKMAESVNTFSHGLDMSLEPTTISTQSISSFANAKASPEKNFAPGADAPMSKFDPSLISEYDSSYLKRARNAKRIELDLIDIDTQDPEEVERGAELAALLSDIEDELKKR